MQVASIHIALIFWLILVGTATVADAKFPRNRRSNGGLVLSSNNRNYRIVPDRREAIRRAVAVAMGGGWSVLVAGKGHENEQIVGNQRLPFSDREELERAIVEQRGGEGRG